MKRLAESRHWTNESAYAVDFGAFGYYSRVKIKDKPALVYPDAMTKYDNDGRKIVLGERPEWALMTVVKDEMEWMLSPELAALYEPVWRGSEHGYKDLVTDINVISPVWSHDFILFKRRDYSVDAANWNTKY